MIYPGTDLKLCVISNIEDFTFSDGNFTVRIMDRYGRVRYSITKEDCFYDTDGRCYFTLEDLRKGVYYAFFRGSYEDEDYGKMERVFTDIQKIFSVGYAGCRVCDSHCSCARHAVTYALVQTININGDEYLADVNGNYILTSDGQRIAFSGPNNNSVNNNGKVRMGMTGDEFKALIEGRSDDGHINTVPEMIDVMNGLDEDTELTVMTSQDVDSMMARVLGNNDNNS